jgi:hypothetical protein
MRHDVECQSVNVYPEASRMTQRPRCDKEFCLTDFLRLGHRVHSLTQRRRRDSKMKAPKIAVGRNYVWTDWFEHLCCA